MTTADLLTVAIAGYAATVSTWGLAWQIRNARREHKPDVKVLLSLRMKLVKGLEPGKENEVCLAFVPTIEARNLGSFPVKVDSVRFHDQIKRASSNDLATEGRLPGLIPSHDSAAVSFLPEVRPPLNREASITLTTGERFYATPLTDQIEFPSGQGSEEMAKLRIQNDAVFLDLIKQLHDLQQEIADETHQHEQWRRLHLPSSPEHKGRNHADQDD
jgi:hypothetical protein